MSGNLQDKDGGNVYHQVVKDVLEMNEYTIEHAYGINAESVYEGTFFTRYKNNLERDIRANIFPRYFPEINPENIKLDIKRLFQDQSINNLGNKTFIVPFNSFFYPYTIDVKEDESVTIVKNWGRDTVLTRIETEYGPFWFIAKTSQPLNSVDVKDHTYDDDITRLTLFCRQGKILHGLSKLNVIIFARVDPYICANCGAHAPGMNKCKGCWDNLKICVRYCNKECQKEDYVKRHRQYCGCKAGADRSRRLEFEARSDPCKEMTLESLHESAKC